ncbi:methionyl-tRNA formyltransferase [Paenibacillus thermotolerans]|uniref:methionyl-tRNA formyltransferase n=1 Tax=Paenibacillus thermotolerans TaxID=3027807 RepID=UPI0023687022|nr:MULTISPECIES: methionyl-tRNA formyltransferase [unclassified Paenibacillus]
MMKSQFPAIVFMGTPDFAVPCLRALIDAGYNVVAAVTQPDRPVGRKRVLTPTPVKEEALRHGIPVLQPVKLRAADAVEELAAFKPDLIVTAAYGQILPKSVLELPHYGCINVHGSLLPKYRGGAPIQRSVMNGDTVTGVTIMYMAEGLDTGDMISVVRVPIEPEDDTGSMYEKLSAAGAELLIPTVASILDGTATRTPQDDAQSTYAPNLSRDDERIDWSKPAAHIHNQVRGLSPRPGAFTYWNGDVFKVWKTAPEQGSASGKPPGTVVTADGDGIRVAAGDGILRLLTVQPAGKKALPAADFVRGGQLKAGDRLGEATP